MATAAGGSPIWENVLSLRTAKKVAEDSGMEVVEHLVRGGGSSVIGRTISTYHFLKSDCTHWMLTGCDVTVPPHYIVRLVEDDKDVVGGVYPKKVVNELIPAIVFHDHTETWKEKVKSQLLLPAVFVSGDTYCFKREVLETLWNKHTELSAVYPETEGQVRVIFSPTFAQTTNGPIYMEEDWAICHRARLAGFEIWADCAVQCGHYTGIFRTFEELYVKQSERVGSQGEGLREHRHDDRGQLHTPSA